MPNDHPPASPSPRPAARPPARSAPPATPPEPPAEPTAPAPLIPDALGQRSTPPGPPIDPNADAPDEFDDDPAAGLGAANVTREREPEQDVQPPPPPAAIGGVIQLEPDHAEWIHQLLETAADELGDASSRPAFDFLAGELRRLIHRPA